MNKKYVYLFELDSSRKSDQEIIVGQRALHDEILRNGNIVVLTFNQLIDSRGFFSLLDDEEYYGSILSLFEKGYIRISQFGAIRTLSQYLLNTIDSADNEYLYSALPIKNSQRRLIALIKRSLIYSDLSEIKGYIHCDSRTEDELRDLFVEVRAANSDNGKHAEEPSGLSTNEMMNIIENIYWLLGMVLRLSTLHNIYVPPRDPIEYSNYRLRDYLNYVTKITMSFEEDRLWNNAVAVITELSCFGSNNRSLYFRELKKISEHGSVEKPVLQYAEAIVSICTNYAYEVSICDISKHYSVVDLKNTVSAESSFFRDFYSRLGEHWNDAFDADKRFLREETDSFIEFVEKVSIPRFAEVARIVPKVEKGRTTESLPRYEYNLELQRRRHKFALLKGVPGQIASLLFAAFLAMLLSILIELGHCVASGDISALSTCGTFLRFGVEAVLVFVIGEFITSIISKRVPRFLSLAEASQGLVRTFRNAFYLLTLKSDTYVSEYDVERKENRNHSVPIGIPKPDELKKYERLCNDNPALTRKILEYPIADVSKQEIQDRIVRDQELYGRKYGVVYSSPYNTLVVDPIEDGAHYYPYERIIPTSMKDGVVLLTMRKGKFVLIKQLRHAIRRMQLCCPRGFGEVGIETVENAKKELLEELGAAVTEEPIKLGTVTGDSGLLGGEATVYLMKIEKYHFIQEEGIREILELTPAELNEKIKSGEIDDGYTLSAFALYCARSCVN